MLCEENVKERKKRSCCRDFCYCFASVGTIPLRYLFVLVCPVFRRRRCVLLATASSFFILFFFFYLLRSRRPENFGFICNVSHINARVVICISLLFPLFCLFSPSIASETAVSQQLAYYEVLSERRTRTYVRTAEVGG